MHGLLELARDLRYYGTSLTSSARSTNSRFRKHDWLDFFSFRVRVCGLDLNSKLFGHIDPSPLLRSILRQKQAPP
jgi:hypothetical protein